MRARPDYVTPARVLVAAGVIFRLGQLLEGQSLWGDEAMLALNVIGRSYGELLLPLGLAQTAPPAFLWLERLLYQLLGHSELAFRLLPFVASCALLPAFYRLAVHAVGPRAALAGTALLACAAPLIGYAAEAKPYALDALVACLLLVVFIRRLDHANARGWLQLGLIGCAAIVWSTSSAFVLAGFGAAVLAQVGRRALPVTALGWSAAVGVIWLALFLASYTLLFDDIAASEYMQQFWAHAFLVPGDNFGDRLWDGVAAVFNPVGALVYPPLLVPIFVAAFLGGAIVLTRRGMAQVTTLAVVPVLCAFAASAIGRYPLSGRLMFFAVPGVVLLIATALVALGDRVEVLTRVPSRWLVTVALLPFAILAIGGLAFRSRPYEELGPTVAALRLLANPSDPVYVFNRNTPTWLFYTLDPERPDREAIAWVSRHASPGGLGQMNGPSRGRRTPGEGAELVYTDGERRVLIGVASGSQFQAGVGFVPARTDANWANNEATRIRAAADPVIWLVMADYGRGEPQENAEVLEAVAHQGGALELMNSAGNTRLYRARFAERAGSASGATREEM